MVDPSVTGPRPRRVALAALGLVAVAGAGCSQDAPSALDPKGPAAERIESVWWLMLGIAVAVFVVVGGLIVASTMRGRGTDDGRPSRITANQWILVGGVAVPAVILAGLAVPTITTTADLTEDQPGALRIEVEGYKWWWEVRYPDSEVVTANEIHVPVGQPIELELTTADVIHSFWVPQLAGKVDMVPGQPNTLRFTAEEAGTYRGACAEYCGVQHARMAMLVVADPPATFERWMDDRQGPAPEPPNELASEGEDIFMRSSCAGCHAVAGTSARGQEGPDLTDFGSRQTLGAATVENTRGNLGGWIADAQSLKPGNLMPPISVTPDELLALIEYLENLK